MKMKKNLIDYELLWEKITDYVKLVLYFYYIMYCEAPKLPLRIKC